MRYCKRCLYPANHPLHLTFDEEGICSGCRVHEEKDSLDWSGRAKKLESLLSNFRSDSKTTYDCIVPVSGARDSYFIVHTLKKIYGMNPLLVTYNKQYNTKKGIQNLAYLRTLFDCDCLTMTVDPRTVKKLTRVTLREMASMYWHCLAGQTVFPVRTAVQLKVPLIVWGVHQGCDQVGMFSHTDEVEMTRKYRKEHDLMGYEAEDLLDISNELSKEEMTQFFYPHDKDVEKVGVRGIYLSNYIRWDSKRQHEEMIDLYGYESAAQQRTFDTYNDVDCFHYSGTHDFIKYLKYGYGKVTDHASREMRLKRLTRCDAIAKVKQFQNLPPDDLPLFLRWLEMSETEFMSYIDDKRDPQIWKQSGDGTWELKDSICWESGDAMTKAAALTVSEDCQFVITKQRDNALLEEKYMLFGKGFVHGSR